MFVQPDRAAVDKLHDIRLLQRLVDVEVVVVARRDEAAYTCAGKTLLGELDPAPNTVHDRGAKGNVAISLVGERLELATISDVRILAVITDVLLEGDSRLVIDVDVLVVVELR